MPAPKDPIKRAEWVEKISFALTGYTQTAEHKAKRSVANKIAMVGILKSEEHKARIGVTNKISQNFPDVKAKKSIAQVGNQCAYIQDRSHIGGMGYPLSFYDIVEEIRDRDGRMCTSCGKLEEDNKKKLSIHHIDENKLNSDPENLITLCMSCHNKLHPDRSEFKC